MRLYLLFSFLLISIFSYAQIELVENFNASNSIPTGWVNNGFDDTNSTLICEGVSLFANMSAGNPVRSIATPYLTGASNATDLTISYDLMVVNFNFFDGVTPVADGWGNVIVEYTTDSVSWISLETISDANFTSVTTCTNRSYSVDAANLPADANFQMRLTVNLQEGSWFFILDNVSITQLATAIPNCDATLTAPANGSSDIQLETDITWSNASGLPAGYKISIGSTPGGTDVADNVDVGDTNSYTPTTELAYSTTYYVTIVSYNALGDGNGCIEESFTTRNPPLPGASCENAINISTFPFNDSNTNEGYDNNYNMSPCNDTYMSGLEVVYAITPTEQSSINVRFDNIVGNRASIHVLDDCPDIAQNCLAYFGAFNPTDQYYENLILEANHTYYIVISSSIETSIFTYDLEVTMNPCVIPAVELTATPDCDNGQYTVDIDITRFGSGETLTISDDQGNPSQQVNTTDLVSFGPYPTTTLVQFTIVNDQDNFCTIVEDFEFYCPPLNDECSGAFEITPNADLSCSNITSGTLRSATPSISDFSTCAAIAKDVWFSFVATNAIHTIEILNRVVVEGSFSTLAFEVLEGSCDGGLSSLLCSDFYYDNIGNLTIGNTYFIRIYNTNGDHSVSFDICLSTPPDAPLNDSCSNAIELLASSNQDCENLISGTTISAFNTEDNTCSGDYNEVWYSFTPPNTGYFETNLDITEGSATTYMSFWSGSCSALELESDCNLTPTMTNYALAGQTYYIMVRSIQGSPGVDFTLCTYQVYPPANNECNTPVLFLESVDETASNLVVGNNVGATYSSNACYSASNEGVWYAFTAQYTGPYTFNFTRIQGSGYFAVFEGDCEELEYVSGIGSCFNNGEKVINLVAGRTYKVSAHSSSPAYFEFFVYPNNPPPANDNCTTATVLTASTAGSCDNLISGTTLSAASTNDNDCSLGNYDVWYTFTPDTEGYYQFELTQTSGEAALGMVLLGGNCGVLEQQSLNCANVTMIENLVADSTYTLLVSSDAGNEQTGVNFDLCVTPVIPPSNNDCSTAISFLESVDINGENTVSGITDLATYSMEACYDTNYEGVWYSFTPTYTGQYIFNFTGDATYAIYEGDCETAILISMDCYNAIADTFPVIGGSSYLVSVHSEEAAAYDFFLYPGLLAPANNDCANAEGFMESIDETGNNLVSGTSEGAFNSPEACYEDTYEGVWYAFTPQYTGTYTIDFTSLSGDATYAVYTGECEDLAFITDNENCYTSGESIITVEAGVTYTFSVHSEEAATFEFFVYPLDVVATEDLVQTQGLRYFPNPLTNGLLKVTADNTITSIRVFNTLGQQVVLVYPKANQHLVDMSNLSKGIYFVDIEIDGQNQTVKVINE